MFTGFLFAQLNLIKQCWLEIKVVVYIFNKTLYKKAENEIVEKVSLPEHINKVIIPAYPKKYKGDANKDISVSAIICPFHDDTDPSFSYEKRRNFANCFGCSVGGNVIGIHRAFMSIQLKSKVSYVDALLDLANMYKVEIPKFIVDESDTLEIIEEDIKSKIKDYKERRSKLMEKVRQDKTNVITNKRLYNLNERVSQANLKVHCLFDMIIIHGKEIDLKNSELNEIFKRYLKEQGVLDNE